MRNRSPQTAEKIRERLGERVLAGAPQWLAATGPATRSNALALLIGTLLGRLPAEDVSALVYTILLEQNADGSWSLDMDAAGDLSLTLEVVEALSTCGDSHAREALDKAVRWLERHRHSARLSEETLILLSAVTEVVPGSLRRMLMPVARLFMLRSARKTMQTCAGGALPLALSLLSRDKLSARGKGRRLLELQLLDGSWEGSSRTTVFALAALRHTALPLEDSAFERGWRFLRSLQLWDSEGLVQNPCDVSNILHATALRTLLVTAADQDVAAGSTLSLLHQARMSGGWALGGMLPTDLLTSALALDALSFAGDVPVETSWARRRTVLLFLRAQNSDGGWPLYTDGWSKPLWPGKRYASRIDVTAAAVQALAYSGVQEPGEEDAIARGLDFLLHRQTRRGLWRGDVNPSAVFATARTLEALFAASNERAADAVLRGAKALIALQQTDGGWGESLDLPSTPQHTAWALRALTGAPGVPQDVITKAKFYLEASVDRSELLWNSTCPAWPLPLGEHPAVLADLVTMWALEALAPTGIISRSRIRGGTRSRSIFDRRSR
ncbi:MAG TPA: prenyltransferase/squalene oxidase repeat-containing protein [bacterium]|jgi:hypothetical protein